ncbi:MAG: serine/threonine-protein kinase [Acidobacteriota bacterium]
MSSFEDQNTAEMNPGSPVEPSGHTFAPGDMVAGRYRIVRFIGRGGMGEVFEAEDAVLGVRVALKVIRGQAAAKPGAIERFRQEIQLARRVTHPNVCRVYDIGYHGTTGEGTASGGLVFFTMELLQGETLADRIRRCGGIPEADAFLIIRQVASALDAAHGEGIIHRDLKPANVILAPVSTSGGHQDVRAVVTDFGMARLTAPDDPHAATAATAGLVAGTPAYMSPEQVELALGDVDSLATDTLDRLRRSLGTDFVLIGSYLLIPSPSGDQLRLDLRLQDTRTGETVVPSPETGADPQLLDLVARAGANLREKLGTETIAPAQANAARALSPTSPAAVRLYSEGLARQRSFDDLGARDLLEQAVRAEPALGELEVQYGEKSAGRARLQAIQVEARQRGFGTI